MFHRPRFFLNDQAVRSPNLLAPLVAKPVLLWGRSSSFTPPLRSRRSAGNPRGMESSEQARIVALSGDPSQPGVRIIAWENGRCNEIVLTFHWPMDGA
jgi:hypothetical protein